MRHSLQALITAYSDKRYQKAQYLALSFVKAYPMNAMGWKVLGASFAQLGMPEKAVVPFRKVIDLAPTEAEAHFNLGAVLHDLGQLKEAETLYRKFISLQPQNLPALNNLGNLLCDLHRPDEAEHYYQMSLSIEPNNPQGLSNYASVLLEMGRIQEAEESAGKAISLQPDFGKAYVNLGGALRVSGKYPEALAVLQQAISLAPGEATAYNNLGSVFLDMGRFKEARASFERALELNPRYAECHNNLSQMKTWREDDPQIPVLRQLYQTFKDPVARMHICFALGNALADLNQHEEAFSMLGEGNRLRKESLNYTLDQDRQLFARIRSAFEELQLEQTTEQIPSRAILIVGMPRSGTSLAEQILASHPDVTGGGELAFLNKLALECLDAEGLTAATAWKNAALAYEKKLDGLREGRPLITDKMPLNFLWLGFALRAYPDLKVVHVMRDPMATCWSIFRYSFTAKGLGFAYDLKDLGNYYLLYRELMSYWHEKFPGRIYDLGYERLTENQKAETQKLLEYCRLSWDDRCLEFEKTERPVRTASATQVRQKIYQGSSLAWIPYEPYLQPLRDALNGKG